jgi:hypothetical protein
LTVPLKAVRLPPPPPPPPSGNMKASRCVTTIHPFTALERVRSLEQQLEDALKLVLTIRGESSDSDKLERLDDTTNLADELNNLRQQISGQLFEAERRVTEEIRARQCIEAQSLRDQRLIEYQERKLRSVTSAYTVVVTERDNLTESLASLRSQFESTQIENQRTVDELDAQRQELIRYANILASKLENTS